MGQNYDKSTAPALNYYASKINQANLNTNDIVAAPFGADEVYNLNSEKIDKMARVEEK